MHVHARAHTHIHTHTHTHTHTHFKCHIVTLQCCCIFSFGGGRKYPINLHEIYCHGNESRLIDCEYEVYNHNYCHYSENVAIVCDGKLISSTITLCIQLVTGYHNQLLYCQYLYVTILSEYKFYWGKPCISRKLGTVVIYTNNEKKWTMSILSYTRSSCCKRKQSLLMLFI